MVDFPFSPETRRKIEKSLPNVIIFCVNQESIYIFILGFTQNINSFLNVLLLEKIVHIICLGQKFDSFSNHKICSRTTRKP